MYVYDSYSDFATPDWPEDLIAEVAGSLGEKYVEELDIRSHEADRDQGLRSQGRQLLSADSPRPAAVYRFYDAAAILLYVGVQRPPLAAPAGPLVHGFLVG